MMENILLQLVEQKSFEAALYLCEYLYGKDIAKSLASGLVIDWNLDKVKHLVIEK